MNLSKPTWCASPIHIFIQKLLLCSSMDQCLLCTWLLEVELQKWIVVFCKLWRLAHPNTTDFTVTLVLRHVSYSRDREGNFTRCSPWVHVKDWISRSPHSPASPPSCFYPVAARDDTRPDSESLRFWNITFNHQRQLLGLALLRHLKISQWHLKREQHSSIDFGAAQFVSVLCHIDVAGSVCVWDFILEYRIESPPWPCVCVELHPLLGPRVMLWGNWQGWHCLR